MLNRVKLQSRLLAGVGAIIAMAVRAQLFANIQVGAISDDWHEFAAVTNERRVTALQELDDVGSAVHYFKHIILRGGDYFALFVAMLARVDADAQSDARTARSFTPVGRRCRRCGGERGTGRRRGQRRELV